MPSGPGGGAGGEGGAREGYDATGLPIGPCLLSQGAHGACLHTHATPNKSWSRPLRSSVAFRHERKPANCPGSEHSAAPPETARLTDKEKGGNLASKRCTSPFA